MFNRRILSLLLSFLMLITAIPVFAEDTVDSSKRVYLHAREGELTDTPYATTVYKGDAVNVYFAVDNPNDGKITNGVHEQPQYDMNGYTVKIYYDTQYFNLLSSASAPVDYKIPNENASSGTTEVKPDGSDDSETVPDEGAYFFVNSHGSEPIEGTTWSSAYITVFFTGSYLPENKGDWYNLCKLPLEAKKTGSSQVYIDIQSGDEHTLELFAKDVPGGDYPPTFEFSAENGGYHTINIKESTRPMPPVADPASGTFTEAQKVTLTADEGCTIYYSIDGGKTYVQYSDSIDPDKKEKIPVDRSMEIMCYAEKNGKKSTIQTYSYKITPKAPVLFNSAKDDPIPNIYSEYSAFRVYASDDITFGGIDIENGNKVYYTFESLDPGEEGWIELPNDQSILIEKRETVGLVTYNVITGEYSTVSEYYLSVKPAGVTASHETGVYDEKIDVTLKTETKGAEIYYTTDGTDPKTNGILYTVPITLGMDTTLRAVAKYDGVYGDVSSFHYIFTMYDDYGVDAFYPSGGYEGSVNVTLTPHNPENTVKYSTDGGKTWQDFTDVIVVDKDTEIIAKAVDKDGKEGEEYKFIYKIKPLPPVFAPESTQFTNADKITIFCPERTEDNADRFELYYTTDGSDPIKYGTLADTASDSAVIDIKGYTVVSAVIKKDGTAYSTVVTHSYDIVTQKPVKPITTLTPGDYTREIGDETGYSTQFMPVPAGTEIYYTVTYDGTFCADPNPGSEGTYKYDGTPIPVKGKTTIKAVAVNKYGTKSDIGIFAYVVTPEAPKAAPSATVGGDALPVVPVEAVAGSTVKYKIGGFENEFVTEDGSFYIDTKTGSAYEDEACTKTLGKQSTVTNDKSATLEIWAELDGVESFPNMYIYTASGDSETLAPPYADKATGMYEEIDIDGNNNLLIIHLYSLNNGDTIEYMLDNSGTWNVYNGDLRIKQDTVLQIRSTKNGKCSTVEGYVYNFVPLAPVITLQSGRYSSSPVPETYIKLDEERAPEPFDKYYIFYRRNGDAGDYRLTWDNTTLIQIEHTMSLKAYVKNRDTGKISANTIHYYIIEQDISSGGAVEMASPYYGLRRLSAHLISEKPYSEGIRLFTDRTGATINYYYHYTKTDGTDVTTNTMIYDDAAPIFVSPAMESIRVTAWLTDSEGNEIEGSRRTFDEIDFVHLEIPKTSLEEQQKVEFPKGTKFTILNDYPDDDNISIYYTTDGSDPSNESNTNRKLYGGEELTLSGAMTVKTVYHSACGTCYECKASNKIACWYGVYGEVGNYRYTVPTVQYVSSGSGGGGGGGGGTVTETIDNTRKYTKDIFGNEHPTHIGYISGYPDGSVQPDGKITREETAAILYRIKIQEYEEPFITTGSVFPDVFITRWSATEIEYMANEDVIKGYPDGEFKPERQLTRAEFAALIRRFVKLDDSDAENVFEDVAEEHWAYNDIVALCATGLIEGYEDGSFRPEDQITRAEVMTVINKLLGRNPSDPYVKSLKFNPFNDLQEDKWYYVIVLEATITHNYYLDDEGVEIKWEDCK